MKRFPWSRSDASAGPSVAVAASALAMPRALDFPRADARALAPVVDELPAPDDAQDAAAARPRRTVRIWRSVSTLLFGSLLLVVAWTIGVSYYFNAVSLGRLLEAEEREKAAQAAHAVHDAVQQVIAGLQATVESLQADAGVQRMLAGDAAPALAPPRGASDLVALFDARGRRIALASPPADAEREQLAPPAWPAAEIGRNAALTLHPRGERLVLRASGPVSAARGDPRRLLGRVVVEREIDAAFLLRAVGARAVGAALTDGEALLLATPSNAEPPPLATLASAIAAGAPQFFELDGSVDVQVHPLSLSGPRLAVVAQVAESELRPARASGRDELAVVVLLTLGVALVLGVVMTRSLIRPIGRLTERAEELSLRYAGRSVARRGTEFDSLVTAFDAMTEALLGHSERLKRAHLNELQNSLELQRQYALMRLLRGLAAAANESDSVEQALERSVHEIGEYLDWPLGRAALLSGDSEAPEVPRSLWFVREPERFAGFIADTEQRPIDRSMSGLIGRAYVTGMPHWVSDLGRLTEFSRRELAQAAGLRSGVVIPVIARGHTTAFIEFYSDHRVEATAEMLELVEAIGVELSRVAERHRNERDLRASERETRRLAMVTAHTEKFVAICDTQGRVKWVNDAVVQLSGFARDDLVGRLPQQLVSGPDTDSASLGRMGRAIVEGRPCLEELVFYSRDGRRFVHQVEGLPLLDEGGRVDEYALISTDVTGARQAEAALRSSEMYFRALFDLSPVPAAIQDAGLQLARVNEAYARLLGCRMEDLIGRDPIVFIHPEDQQEALVQRGRLLAVGEATDFERRLVGADGVTRWVRVHVAALVGAAGEPVFLSVVDDISDIRADERILREARDAAESANRAKSQFLANMSHEIRTPMNGVLGMTELLLGTPLSDKQRRFAEAVYRSGESLLQIINDILDFSKIEAGRLELDAADFDLRGVVEDVFELLAPRALDKRIELACRIGPGVPEVVCGDPVRLRQVLTNLVGNAIKFTEQGEIVVQVAAAGGCQPVLPGVGDVGHRIQFEVRDTGIGIPPDALERLFTSFMQADQSMSRRYGGTGLGLAISKQLVELMGGSISADSRVGEGSTFRFDVCLRAGDVARLRSPLPAASLAGRRVIVVEDNPTNRSILEGQLRGLGAECAAAEHGAAALELLRAAARDGQHFDAAIVDMKMPVMDGLTLAAALRRDPALSRIAIILLTSLARSNESLEAQGNGVDICLAKPVRQQELMKALGGALSARRAGTADAPAAPSASCLRVLLVEDNPVNQEVARVMLEHLGCAVRLAGNGRQGLEALKHESFDLVLMDCQMPEMDGFEALRRLRESRRAQDRFATPGSVPVYALTANALAGDAERCLAAGFDGYLPKPVRQQQLAQAIAHVRSRAPSDVGPGVAAPGTERAGLAVPAAAPATAQAESMVTDGADAAPAAANDAAVLDPTVIDRIRDMERRGAARLLERLIGAYLDSAARLVTDAERAIEADDANALRQAVHTLKSSSANLGATDLSARCATLEGLARAGRVPAARTQWPAARREHERVVHALQALAAESARTS